MFQRAAAAEVQPETGPGTHLGSDRRTPRKSALREVRSALPEELRHRVRSARDLSRRQRRERNDDPFPTALAPLDRLLDGGLPRGRLVELVGRRSGGRLSALLTVLAAVTATGETVALVDLGDGLDPRSAADAGVDLERLLWVRPRRTREALAAAEILLEGGFPLVAMDLGTPPVTGGRGVEAGWLRLARQAKERRAALLVASPYRVSGTAAATVLAVDRERTVWCRGDRSRDVPRSGPRLAPLLAGLHTELTRDKHRGAAPGMQEALAFHAATPWAAYQVAAESGEEERRAVPAPLPFLRRASIRRAFQGPAEARPEELAAWTGAPLIPANVAYEPEALAAGG